MKLSVLSTFSTTALALAAMVAVATPAQAGLFDIFKRNPDASQPGPTPPGGLADPADANMGAQPMQVQSGSAEANAAMRMDRMEQQTAQPDRPGRGTDLSGQAAAAAIADPAQRLRQALCSAARRIGAANGTVRAAEPLIRGDGRSPVRQMDARRSEHGRAAAAAWASFR